MILSFFTLILTHFKSEFIETFIILDSVDSISEQKQGSGESKNADYTDCIHKIKDSFVPL